jgi:hypothetical protein
MDPPDREALMNVWVGMDVHRTRSQVAIVDAADVQQRNRKLANDPAEWCCAAGECDNGHPGPSSSGSSIPIAQTVSRELWYWTLQPETSRSICRILTRKLISIGRQPMPINASRCYLIQTL